MRNLIYENVKLTKKNTLQHIKDNLTTFMIWQVGLFGINAGALIECTCITSTAAMISPSN